MTNSKPTSFKKNPTSLFWNDASFGQKQTKIFEEKKTTSK